MLATQSSVISGSKQNIDIEESLYRYQGELDRLQQELRDEEADAVEVSDLNGEV